MSLSEQRRVGYSLSVALATLSGVPIVVFDDTESVSPQNRAAFGSLLGYAAAHGIQVVAMSGRTDLARNADLPEGWVGYVIEEGRTERLADAQARWAAEETVG